MVSDELEEVGTEIRFPLELRDMWVTQIKNMEGLGLVNTMGRLHHPRGDIGGVHRLRSSDIWGLETELEMLARL